MASSGTSLFGNFSSAHTQPTAKSPKSPSGKTILENPLLKGAPFSFGGSSAFTTQPTSAALQTMPRSPLLAVTPNRDNIRHDSQGEQKARMSQIATPGPPPRMSLSLMGGMAMPIQPQPAMTKPQIKGHEKILNNLKTPAAVSTPVPVASPPLLEKKTNTDSYFKESSSSNFSSESLVADHWVVAHGYTSSNEYKELLAILSSYGTIQSQESGGNWLAVLYESRLSAEKALCCQPILLSNTLCGTTRGTPSLLQSLSSGKGENRLQDGMMQGDPEPLAGALHHDNTTRGNLNERDILQLENSAYESRKPYQPKSVCDKVFAWYFGWEEQHPHSD